jgi:hypothetical protein
MFALLMSRQTDQPRDDPARLLIGPSNGVVDHLAQTMEPVIQQHFRGRTLLVTRCHAMTTEEELAWAPAARQRPRLLMHDLPFSTHLMMGTTYLTPYFWLG